MEAVARHLLGKPNRVLSSSVELRYGNHGSLSIDLREGVWINHENPDEKGGVLDLIARETGLANGAAVQWMRDELGINIGDRPQKRPDRCIVATYNYHDQHGQLLYQVVRFEPKDFRQRRPDGTGGWTWSVKGVRQVPYRLFELQAKVAHNKVLIVEGEKDVDRLAALNFVATCNAGGAGKWPSVLNEHFAGKDVAILADNDDAGRKHADLVASKLRGIAEAVRIVNLPGLPPKGDVSDWLDGGGDHKELIKICNDAPSEPAAGAGVETTRTTAAGGRRPRIRSLGGDLPDAVAAGLDALAGEPDPFASVYARGNMLVRPVRLASGSEEVLSLLPVELAWLRLRLAQIADWFVPDEKGDDKPIDPPRETCRAIMAASPWPQLRWLLGVVESPTVRSDGSLLTQPGYDTATGLLFDPGETKFPPIPEEPSRSEAEASLAVLEEPFRDFPFADEASRSVALASILTAMVRRILPSAPLFAYSAPKMASGKTLLATLPSYVATGRPPYLMSHVTDPAEERKRLLAALIECPSALVIDNVEHGLGSDALCTVLTEPRFTDRLLGQSKTVTVATNTMFAATGNNLQLAGDLSTRAVLCRLDPQCERPEEREFKVNLHDIVPADRGRLATAALTIIRAYLAAGAPRPAVANFARFEQWQCTCRFPLIWLGCADPCATRARIEAVDAAREDLKALLSTWKMCLGDTRVTVAGAVKGADDSLRESMTAVAGERGGINNRKLGRFMSRYEGRIEDGLQFVRDGEGGGVTYWRAVAGGLGGFRGFVSNAASNDPLVGVPVQLQPYENNPPKPPNPPTTDFGTHGGIDLNDAMPQPIY